MSGEKKAPADKKQAGFYRALSEADAKRVQAEFQEKGLDAEIRLWSAPVADKWDVFAFEK